ncbi:hypothetical protein SHIRM173S_09741 [Streptomyces hirsutus]
MIDGVDRAVSARGVLLAMKEEVAKARYPGFFRRYVQLEAEAIELHAYVNHAIKGLLQTEECARAVFQMWRPLLDEEAIEQGVNSADGTAEAVHPTSRSALELRLEEHVLGGPWAAAKVGAANWNSFCSSDISATSRCRSCRWSAMNMPVWPGRSR